MNKTWLLLLSLFFSSNTFSQKYDFQTIKDINITPVTAQENTGTDVF
jgi:hypothetical protein